MERDKKRQNGNQASQFIAAGNSYFTRADSVAAAAQGAVSPPVDSLVQDIEDKLQAEDKSADVARLEAAGVECYRRAKALIDEVAPPHA